MEKEQLKNHVGVTFAPEMLEIAAQQQPIEDIEQYGKVIWNIIMDYQRLVELTDDETLKTYYIAQAWRLVSIVTKWGLSNGIY